MLHIVLNTHKVTNSLSDIAQSDDSLQFLVMTHYKFMAFEVANEG
jgi:hypothetical protein